MGVGGVHYARDIANLQVGALVMGATNLAATTSSQWMFPLSALHNTPSRATSNIPLEKELYDRSRGVEFLYRLGVSLGLSVSLAPARGAVAKPPSTGLLPQCTRQRPGFTASTCGTPWRITTDRSEGGHARSTLRLITCLGRRRVLHIPGHQDRGVRPQAEGRREGRLLQGVPHRHFEDQRRQQGKSESV